MRLWNGLREEILITETGMNQVLLHERMLKMLEQVVLVRLHGSGDPD